MAKRALCIAVNNYPGLDMDLSGCVNDATDWSDVLDRFGYRTRVLLDGAATKHAVIGEMKRLVAESRSGDALVIQISSHGTYGYDVSGDEPDMRDEAICQYDVVAEGPIWDDQIDEILGNRAHGVRLLLISDSCHSGTVARFAAAVPVEDATQSRVRFIPPEQLGIQSSLPMSATRGPTRHYASLLMGACRDWEYAYDAWFGIRPNGAFTRAAIDALRKVPDGATYNIWMKEIRKALPTMAYPQTPQLVGTSHRRGWGVLA